MSTAAGDEIHVCIATGQNLANLIPAFQCGARELWILKTRKMVESARNLATAARSRKIQASLHDFDDQDVTTLRQQAEKIAEELDGRRVVINVTGGTKLMTLALVEVLAPQLATNPAAAPRIVYCDTARRRLDWLGPEIRSEAMKDVLEINDILLAQGYRQVAGGGADAAHRQRSADERKDLTDWLGRRAKDLGGFFGVMNAMAAKALEHDGFKPRQELHRPPAVPDAKECIERCRAAGLIDREGAVGIKFHSKEAAQYLGGGWTEEYAQLRLKVTFPRSWMPNLKIERHDGKQKDGEKKVSNEIDAIAVHGNRMLLVESKAARLGEKTADWIYKISRLALNVGGSHTRALLLSARTFDEEHRARARDYGVDVLDGGRLSELDGYLKCWKDGKPWKDGD